MVKEKKQNKVVNLPTYQQFERWYENHWETYGSFGDCEALYKWIRTRKAGKVD